MFTQLSLTMPAAEALRLSNNMNIWMTHFHWWLGPLELRVNDSRPLRTTSQPETSKCKLFSGVTRLWSDTETYLKLICWNREARIYTSTWQTRSDIWCGEGFTPQNLKWPHMLSEGEHWTVMHYISTTPHMIFVNYCQQANNVNYCQ